MDFIFAKVNIVLQQIQENFERFMDEVKLKDQFIFVQKKNYSYYIVFFM